jgi:hypothetical protein
VAAPRGGQPRRGRGPRRERRGRSHRRRDAVARYEPVEQRQPPPPAELRLPKRLLRPVHDLRRPADRADAAFSVAEGDVVVVAAGGEPAADRVAAEEHEPHGLVPGHAGERDGLGGDPAEGERGGHGAGGRQRQLRLQGHDRPQVVVARVLRAERAEHERQGHGGFARGQVDRGGAVADRGRGQARALGIDVAGEQPADGLIVEDRDVGEGAVRDDPVRLPAGRGREDLHPRGLIPLEDRVGRDGKPDRHARLAGGDRHRAFAGWRQGNRQAADGEGVVGVQRGDRQRSRRGRGHAEGDLQFARHVALTATDYILAAVRAQGRVLGGDGIGRGDRDRIEHRHDLGLQGLVPQGVEIDAVSFDPGRVVGRQPLLGPGRGGQGEAGRVWWYG